MSHKEHLKISKIIGEIVVFFLNRGYHDIRLHLQKTPSSDRIIIDLQEMNPVHEAEFVKKMNQHREQEIETYGWSLLGESGIELAGLFIDSVDVQKDAHGVHFILERILH